MKTRQLDADVIVAGAGPAGAAVALHLRTHGLEVLLLDWQSFPRDKVCGDFLSAVSMSELARLNLAGRVRRRANVIRHAAVSLDGRSLLALPLPRVDQFPDSGCVLPRKVFDQVLLTAAIEAGASFRSGTRVVGFREAMRHVEVDVGMARRRRVLRAQVLIGADGSTSVVARQLRGQPVDEDDRMIAVRAYFDGVRGPADRADLCFASAAFPGYAWVFPTGRRTANVGVGMVRKTLPQSAEHLPTLLSNLIARDSALRDRLDGGRITHATAGWPLTTYNPAVPIVGRRVALVGDAAGLINPLNGEGIQYALLSARWAADAVVAALARGSFAPRGLQSYANRVTAELGEDLRISRLLVDLIRNRALSTVWLDGLQTVAARARLDPAYATTAAGVLAGIVPTRRVLGLEMVRKTLLEALRRSGGRVLNETVRPPGSLAGFAVRLTDAVLAAARPMLDHAIDTERWAAGLGRSALQITAARIGRSSTGERRADNDERSAREEERIWHARAPRTRETDRAHAAVAARRRRRVDAAAATSSGSPRSTPPPRRS